MCTHTCTSLIHAFVHTDRMASAMGTQGRRLISTVNNCGICGNELKDFSHLGEQQVCVSACVRVYVRACMCVCLFMHVCVRAGSCMCNTHTYIHANTLVIRHTWRTHMHAQNTGQQRAWLRAHAHYTARMHTHMHISTCTADMMHKHKEQVYNERVVQDIHTLHSTHAHPHKCMHATCECTHTQHTYAQNAGQQRACGAAVLQSLFPRPMCARLDNGACLILRTLSWTKWNTTQSNKVWWGMIDM
jgi:hypothetical protein